MAKGESSGVKVSVIMPVFNKEEYIQECLRTILTQTLKDIEVICVDDGSTDSSASIVESICIEDSRVSLIQQANQGAGPARNAGMRAAQGEFIAFMDPDDWYHDSRVLEDLYCAAKSNNVVICGGSLAEYANGSLRTEYPDVRQKYVFEHSGMIEYKDYQFDYGYHRFIYESDFLREHDLLFPAYRRFQDPPFFVRAMTLAKRFWALSRISYVYRVGYKEVSWDGKKLGDLANGLSDVIELATTNGLDELRNLELSRIQKSYLSLFFQSMGWEQGDEYYLRSIKRLKHDVEGIKESTTASECAEALSTLVLDFEAIKPVDLEISYVQKKPENPLVSVIVPVYNVENFLEECIDSLFRQTMTDFEIIAVDDGSTDGSLSILRKKERDDARIIIVEKDNGGLSSARNAGLKQARGRYIQFLDSDDMLAPNALEVLCSRMEKDSLDQLFFSGLSFFDSYQAYKENKSHLGYYDYSDKELLQTRNGQTYFAIAYASDSFKPSACLQIVRRGFLSDNCIEFLDGILHEDNLYTLQCLACNSRVSAIKEQLYYRRFRDGSIMTADKGARNAYGYYASIYGFAQYVFDNGIVLSDDFQRELVRRNKALLMQATKWYAQSSESEKRAFAMSLPLHDRLLFLSTFEASTSFFEESKALSERLANGSKVSAKPKLRKRIIKRMKKYRIGRKIISILRKVKRMLKMGGGASESKLKLNQLGKQIRKALKSFNEKKYLSFGENCLTDDILARYGLKSFSSPFAAARSNVEYILGLQKDDYKDFLNPCHLEYSQVQNSV